MPATAHSSNLQSCIQQAASSLGFDLCGIAPASTPVQDHDKYLEWLGQSFHGEMNYMERPEHADIQKLLPGARSVICVAMLYNTPHPKSIACNDPARGWISRYAWGDDYHDLLRDRLKQLLGALRKIIIEPFDARICVDTAPILERAMAKQAGLGWIAKNTCLIHPKKGSWFLIGEILTTLSLAPDQPSQDLCGSCTRCIDACPTAAIVQPGVLDATRCISYLTIEVKDSIPEEHRAGIGHHVFGCDICQDVCPWNSKAPFTVLDEFQPRAFNQANDAYTAPPQETVTAFNPPLDWLASLNEVEFRQLLRNSPVRRAKFRGLLRNVAVAMGNSKRKKFLPSLRRLTDHPDPMVQQHAQWAIRKIELDDC